MGTQGFHDYTIASNAERFIAVLESTISSWNDTGLDVIVEKGLKGRRYEQPSLITSQVSLKQRLKGWRRDPFLLGLHVPAYVVAPETADKPDHNTYVRSDHAQASTGDNASSSNRHVSQSPAGIQASPLEHKTHQNKEAANLEELGKSIDVSAKALLVQSADDNGQTHDSRSQSPELLTRRRTGREGSILAVSETGAIERVIDENDADLKGEASWQVGVNLDMQDLLQNIEAILQDGAESSSPASETGTPELGTPMHDRSARLSPKPVASLSEQGDQQQSQQQQIQETQEQGQQQQPPQSSPPQLEQQRHSSVEYNQPFPQHEDTSVTQETAPFYPSSHTHPDLPQNEESSNDQPAETATGTLSDSKTPHQPIHASNRPAEYVSVVRKPNSHDYVWWPQKQLYRPWWRYTHQHKLQHWFGLDHFLLLQPQSYSRRLLDESEANILMSCLSCALSNRQLAWPALIPVHDALRDAYWGQVVVPGANMTVESSCNETDIVSDQHACLTCGGVTARLITDSVHISGVSDTLLTLKGQLNLFAEQLAPSAPHTSVICRAVSERYGFSQPTAPSPATLLYVDGHIKCSARYTFKLPLPSMQPGSKRASYSCSETTYTHDNVPWDLEAAWWPWARHNDPVTAMELDLIWENVCIHCNNGGYNHIYNSADGDQRLRGYTITSSNKDDEASCNPWPMLNPSTASYWLLHAVEKGLTDDPGFGLDMQAAERQRQCVTLDEFESPNDAFEWTIYGAENDQDLTRSFHSMLTRMASLKPLLCSADTMGELAADSWWWDRKHTNGFSAGLPPPPSEAALLAALTDIWEPRHRSSPSPLSIECQFPCTAPIDSPLTRLALRCMTFGNARAIAVLWQRFIRSLRIDFWEAGKQLPLGETQIASTNNTAAFNTRSNGDGKNRTLDDGVDRHVAHQPNTNAACEHIDLQASILFQKLQVLNACIARCQAASVCGQGVPILSDNRHVAGDMEAVRGVEPGNDINLNRHGSAVPSNDGSDITRTSSNGNGNGGSEAAQQYYSADEDEEILGRSGMNGAQIITPLGVEKRVTPEIRLINHTDRLMNAPILQPRPLFSEDRRTQRIQQLRGLRQIEGSEQAAGTGPLSDDGLLSLEILSSDMAAFKAANPGAILQDFIAWRESLGLQGSYHETIQQPTQLTGKNGLSDGWANTWDTTAPCAAAAQKPLQDPFQEGERILHDLDTLAVADVVDSLLALGLSASCQLLARCRGASLLPPVTQLVHRFHRLLSVALKAACSPPRAASGSSPAGPVALSGNRLLSGFHELALDHLLEQFSFLEQAVVLSESLFRRLPGSTDLCSTLMTHVIQGKTTPIHSCTPPTKRLSSSNTSISKTDMLTERLCTAQVTSVSDKLAITSLLIGTQRGLLRELTPSPSVVLRDKGVTLGNYIKEDTTRHGQPEGVGNVDTEIDTACIQAEQLAYWDGFWPDAEVREWELLAGRGGRNGPSLDSRMFVQHTNAHTRIALTLVAETASY